MPKLIGQELQQYLINQINVRQAIHGSGVNSKRSPEVISYLNSKTAWAKMASSVIVEPDRRAEENIDERYDGKRLAKQHVLNAGLSAKYDNENNILNPRGVKGKNGFDNLFGNENGVYSVNPTSEVYAKFGSVPMPGIESVDVKCLNRGSIKDITVKIFAYGPEQFKLIDLLYLRLGYTMFIEWGWSLYVNNEGNLVSSGVSIIDSDDGFFRDNFWNTEGVGFRALYDYINDYRIATNGNYDAIVGKVVNYDWSVDDAGKYTITVKLKTFGDIIESLKANLTPTSTVGQFINQAYTLFQSENIEGQNGNAAVDSSKTPPQPVDNSISAFLFLNLLGLNEIQDELTSKNDVPCTLNGKDLVGYNSVFVDSALNVGKDIGITGYKEFTFESEIEEYVEKNYANAKQLSSKTELENIKEPGSYYYVRSNIVTDVVATTTTIGVGLALFTGGLSLVVAGGIATAAAAVSYFIPNYDVYFKVNLDRSALKVGQELKDVFYVNYNLLDNAAAGAKTINPNGLYVRFGFLLDYIKKFVIPYDINVGPNGGKILEIDTSVEENKMYRIPHQISLDPRVCVVRCSEDIGSKDFFDGLNPKQYFTSLPGWQVGGTLEARTMNIYLNAEYINKVIDSNKNDKGDLNLFKLISTFCTDMNRALGGVNNLEPIIDEEKNTLNIIDGSLRRDDFEDAYQFRVLGYSDGINNSNLYESNFVRNFSVKTELTNNLATTLTIGATAGGYAKGTEATAFSKWNQGLIDPFKEKIEVEQEEKDARDDEGEHLDPLISYKRDIWNSTYKGFGFTEPESITEGVIKDAADWIGLTSDPKLITLSTDAINSNVAIGTEFYKYVNARLFTISDKAYSSPSQGFLPISFGLTMDGISGFKIYNSLNIDTRFLPNNYTNTMKFILKNVDHSIKNNDWETQLATIMVSRESIIRENRILRYFDTYAKMKTQIEDIIATDVSEFEKAINEKAKKFNKKQPPKSKPSNIKNIERAFDEDTAPIINPTRQGARFYSTSLLTAQQKTNKQKNGLLKQNNPKVLVFIGETQGAAKYYINPATKRAEYMLHPSAAKAWYKWRDEMKTKGIPFRVSSAYRSVVHQKGLGSGNTVASPGSSPHGWGGALDFGNLYRIIGGSGNPATNLEGRKTQAYYDIASVGAKYGWYNPHRLADNYGLDEIWHFEYWGPV